MIPILRGYAFTIAGIAIGVAGIVALGAMAERIVRFRERDMWNLCSGMIARLRGSTQNRSSASRLSAIGKMPVA